MSTYLRAQNPAPVLNRPDFQQVFTKLPCDEQGLLRAVEFVALPGTLFTLIREISSTVSQVETEDYLSTTPLYVDTRFTEIEANPTLRDRYLPSAQKIFAYLESSIGLPYIWGGNFRAGIAQIAELYPNPNPQNRALYLLQGLDCSGLLYEATQGFTPRNTPDLFTFGHKVPSIEDVKPLDIIVWSGHVLICLNNTTVIESLLGKGVVVSSLKERLPTKSFKIRRLAIFS